tara:strand:+ start:7403 stop:8296 length:894 start_codon:yes stop_codon:yes gene_type:complete
MKEFQSIKRQEIIKLICDGCGLEASTGDDYEFQEFTSINHHCGYGSIHGDSNKIEADLCQQCFADMCGGALRVTDENNCAISNTTENYESSESDKLEYSNIFDAICRSKSEAKQLKNNSDLRVAARDILSKKIIDDKDELTVALKRVEQLWNAQYQSPKRNELHQLVDLICAYEKKDWNSFFEQAPLDDDDFMPDRLNLKPRSAFEEERPAKAMLSSIPINTEISDEASRDSALAENNLDENIHHLLESILHARAKYPDLRFGQLLVNAMNLEQPCPEIFHIEDDELIERLNQLSEL